MVTRQMNTGVPLVSDALENTLDELKFIFNGDLGDERRGRAGLQVVNPKAGAPTWSPRVRKGGDRNQYLACINLLRWLYGKDSIVSVAHNQCGLSSISDEPTALQRKCVPS